MHRWDSNLGSCLSYPLSYMYVLKTCAFLMMFDIEVILSIPLSPVYINALFLFNGKSLPTLYKILVS